jgi:hypothetical protein
VTSPPFFLEVRVTLYICSFTWNRKPNNRSYAGDSMLPSNGNVIGGYESIKIYNWTALLTTSNPIGKKKVIAHIYHIIKAVSNNYFMTFLDNFIKTCGKRILLYLKLEIPIYNVANTNLCEDRTDRTKTTCLQQGHKTMTPPPSSITSK